MVTVNVDIPALKGRHPLGDAVEAAGVRLRGRGRVRQGVCPFHDEAEGQLHGVRRLGAVLLLRLRTRWRRAGLHPAGRGPEPAGGHRAAGRQPWACAQGRHSSSRNAASQVRRAASARPHPADGGGALLRRSTPASHRSEGVPGLPGASARSPQPASVSAMRRAAGCGRPLSPSASRRSVSGLQALHGAGSGAVRRHGRRSRRHRRPLPLARRAGGRSRPDTPLPGPPPAPSRCWVSAVSAPPLIGRSWPRGCSTGSPLPDGASPPSLPWAPRASNGSPPPSGAAPRLPRLRRRRRGPGGDGAASDPARTQGCRRHPSPRRRGRGRAGCPAPRTRRPSCA